MDPAYRDRFRIHIEDTKASMTILTARRSDSGRYKFEVETLNYNKTGGLTSIIEISVQCKYLQKYLVVFLCVSPLTVHRPSKTVHELC